MKRSAIVLAGLIIWGLGCEKQERTPAPPAPVPTPEKKKPEEVKHLAVEARVVSVTLADDCDAQPVSGGKPARTSCLQTSLQLLLTASADGIESKVQIARVELFDEKTERPLGELRPRKPMLWNGSGYSDWNSVIAPKATLNTSWELSAPDWASLGGSREAAAGRGFLVRVTLSVDGQESSADGTVKLPPKKRKLRIKSPPIMVEPPMVT